MTGAAWFKEQTRTTSNLQAHGIQQRLETRTASKNQSGEVGGSQLRPFSRDVSDFRFPLQTFLKHVWSSENNLWKLFLSYRVGPGDQIQVVGLGSKDFTYWATWLALVVKTVMIKMERLYLWRPLVITGSLSTLCPLSLQSQAMPGVLVHAASLTTTCGSSLMQPAQPLPPSLRQENRGEERGIWEFCARKYGGCLS